VVISVGADPRERASVTSWKLGAESEREVPAGRRALIPIGPPDRLPAYRRVCRAPHHRVPPAGGRPPSRGRRRLPFVHLRDTWGVNMAKKKDKKADKKSDKKKSKKSKKSDKKSKKSGKKKK
jgi:hypothetical protein